jgi:hyaluronan synthase
VTHANEGRSHEGSDSGDILNKGRPARWGAALVTMVLCGLLIAHITAQLRGTGIGSFTSIYTIVIAGFIFSRFVLAAMYRAPRNARLEPNLAIIVPAFMESEAVARTIDSCCASAYPPDKLEIVVINDGSTDDTWKHMNLAAARHPGRVTLIDLGRNQGKKAAMAAGIRATSAEFFICVDSDSTPAPPAIRKLAQGFADPKVGAISGVTHVRNADTNLLTRMQAANYFVNFQLFKAAESRLSAVSCASGCFCAYRRAAVLPILEKWENQKLFGRPWSHGDDRALTTMTLRRWKVLYDSEAEAWTDVPVRYRTFFKQQLRWQKSFVGESVALLRHSWRSHPIAFPSLFVASVSGIASPLVAVYQVVWVPVTHTTAPVFYLLSLYLLYASCALFYLSRRNDGTWKYAVISAFFYISFSLQIFWAIIRIRDNRWGTRVVTPTEAPTAEAEPMATVVPLPVVRSRGDSSRELYEANAQSLRSHPRERIYT